MHPHENVSAFNPLDVSALGTSSLFNVPPAAGTLVRLPRFMAGTIRTDF
jgi:hypothetical protein